MCNYAYWCCGRHRYVKYPDYRCNGLPTDDDEDAMSTSGSSSTPGPAYYKLSESEKDDDDFTGLSDDIESDESFFGSPTSSSPFHLNRPHNPWRFVVVNTLRRGCGKRPPIPGIVRDLRRESATGSDTGSDADDGFVGSEAGSDADDDFEDDEDLESLNVLAHRRWVAGMQAQLAEMLERLRAAEATQRGQRRRDLKGRQRARRRRLVEWWETVVRQRREPVTGLKRLRDGRGVVEDERDGGKRTLLRMGFREAAGNEWDSDGASLRDRNDSALVLISDVDAIVDQDRRDPLGKIVRKWQHAVDFGADGVPVEEDFYAANEPTMSEVFDGLAEIGPAPAMEWD